MRIAPRNWNRRKIRCQNMEAGFVEKVRKEKQLNAELKRLKKELEELS